MQLWETRLKESNGLLNRYGKNGCNMDVNASPENALYEECWTTEDDARTQDFKGHVAHFNGDWTDVKALTTTFEQFRKAAVPERGTGSGRTSMITYVPRFPLISGVPPPTFWSAMEGFRVLGTYAAGERLFTVPNELPGGPRVAAGPTHWPVVVAYWPSAEELARPRDQHNRWWAEAKPLTGKWSKDASALAVVIRPARGDGDGATAAATGTSQSV